MGTVSKDRPEARLKTNRENIESCSSMSSIWDSWQHYLGSNEFDQAIPPVVLSASHTDSPTSQASYIPHLQPFWADV